MEVEKKQSILHNFPIDIAWNLAQHLDANSLVSLGKVWRPMHQVLNSNQASHEQLKLQLHKLGMILGNPTAPLLRHPPAAILNALTAFCSNWTRLQFTHQCYFVLRDTAAHSQWQNGDFRSNHFIGHSGGCLYSVQASHEMQLWKVSVYQLPSARIGRYLMNEWAIEVDFQIVAVAVDVKQDILVLIRSENCSFGAIYVYRLSTMMPLYKPYKWEGALEYNIVVGQLEIKGNCIGLWIKTGIESEPYGLQFAPPQLRIFNWKTRVMLKHPIPRTTVWGFQFLDEDTILVSEFIDVPYPKSQLRILKLARGPQFCIDHHRSYTIDIPDILGRKPFRVLIVPNIAPTSMNDVEQDEPFTTDPKDRLVGLRFLYELASFQWQEVIVTVNLNALLSRDFSSFIHLDPSQYFGQDFTLLGRRLIWSSGDIYSRTIHLQDFNVCAARTNLGDQMSQNIQHPKDPSWQTTMSRILLNPTKGRSSVNTHTNIRSGVRSFFVTQDNLAMIIDGSDVGCPGSLILWLYNI